MAKCKRIEFKIPKQTMKKISGLIDEVTSGAQNRGFVVKIYADWREKGLCLNITETKRVARVLTPIWKKAIPTEG